MIGLAITILEGLDPFLRFSKIVSWIVQNWLLLEYAAWSYLFSLLNLSLSKEVYEIVSVFFYMVVFTVAGFRHMETNSMLTSRAYRIFFPDGKFSFAPWRLGLFALTYALTIDGVSLLLALHSNSLRVAFVTVWIISLVTSAVALLVEIQIFEKPKQTMVGVFARFIAVPMFFGMSFSILIVVIVILAFNEIGTNADNFSRLLTQFYGTVGVE